jgi:hypothetical protein
LLQSLTQALADQPCKRVGYTASREGNNKSDRSEHVKENAVALSLTLTWQELKDLDAAFPPPGR